MKNNSVKSFEFRAVDQEEISFKDISYVELWWPLCLTEQNYLCNFGRTHHGEQFGEIILNLNQCLRGKCRS